MYSTNDKRAESMYVAKRKNIHTAKTVQNRAKKTSGENKPATELVYAEARNDEPLSISLKNPISVKEEAYQAANSTCSRRSPKQSSPKQSPKSSKFKQPKAFKNTPIDPGLFKIQIQRKHLEHLANDDLDEISKFEVIYKILKDQLRSHQKKLITMREEKEKDKKQHKHKKGHS